MKQQNWKKVFAFIYTGQAFSIVGTSVVQFAIIWWLTVKTSSAMTLTIASIVGFLPQALLGPFAGVWVDRFSRKRVMMLADSFTAFSSLILGIGFLMGEPPLWFIYLMLFMRAIGSTFHSPALQAAIPALVPPEFLMKAGGWGQLITSAGAMAGPVIGAAVMGFMDISYIMLIDIVGAMIAVGSLAFVKIPELSKTKEKLHVLDDMKQGFQALWHNVPLRTVTLPVLLASVVYMPLGSLLPLLIRVHFNGTAWHNSVVEFLFAGGLLISSFLIGLFGKNKKPFLMMFLATMALGLCALIGGILPPSLFIIFAAVSFAMGCTGTFFQVPYIAYVQKTIPNELLGKVMSLILSAMSFAIPIGLVIAGPIAEAIGITSWFVLSGILMMLTGVLGLAISRKYDNMDDGPEPGPEGGSSLENND